LGVRVRRGRPLGRAAAQHPLHPTAQGRRMYPPECGLRAALGLAAEWGAPRVSLSVGRREKQSGKLPRIVKNVRCGC